MKLVDELIWSNEICRSQTFVTRQLDVMDRMSLFFPVFGQQPLFFFSSETVTIMHGGVDSGGNIAN